MGNKKSKKIEGKSETKRGRRINRPTIIFIVALNLMKAQYRYLQTRDLGCRYSWLVAIPPGL